MDDVLNEAGNILECKECPWYKACALPMRYSTEDIRRQLESGTTEVPGIPMNDAGIQQIMGMATAAQNSILEACPVFIERLRTSPQLAQKLKEMMHHWGQEETGGPTG